MLWKMNLSFIILFCNNNIRSKALQQIHESKNFFEISYQLSVERDGFIGIS